MFLRISVRDARRSQSKPFLPLLRELHAGTNNLPWEEDRIQSPGHPSFHATRNSVSNSEVKQKGKISSSGKNSLISFHNTPLIKRCTEN